MRARGQRRKRRHQTYGGPKKQNLPVHKLPFPVKNAIQTSTGSSFSTMELISLLFKSDRIRSLCRVLRFGSIASARLWVASESSCLLPRVCDSIETSFDERKRDHTAVSIRVAAVRYGITTISLPIVGARCFRCGFEYWRFMRTTLLIAVVSICSFASPCVALTPATPMSNALQSETLNAQLEYCRSVADVVLDASPELAGWDVSSEMGKLLAAWAEVSSALSAAQSLQISAQFSSLINLRDQMKPLEAEYRVLYKPLGDLATHQIGPRSMHSSWVPAPMTLRSRRCPKWVRTASTRAMRAATITPRPVSITAALPIVHSSASIPPTRAMLWSAKSAAANLNRPESRRTAALLQSFYFGRAPACATLLG